MKNQTRQKTGDEGACSLSEALKVNTSLTSMGLERFWQQQGHCSTRIQNQRKMNEADRILVVKGHEH